MDSLDGRFVPPESPASAPFWEATRRQEIALQWCSACSRAIHFPRQHCPHCGGADLDWRPSSGAGVVHAVSVHHVPGQPAFVPILPYVVALVELEGGARLMTNLVGAGAAKADVGDPVYVVWEALSDGRHLPLFTPVQPDAS